MSEELSQELKQEITTTEEKIFALEVTDAETYKLAGEYSDIIKGLKSKIKKKLDPLCDAANKTHKKLTAWRKEEFDKFLPADAYLDTQMTTWYDAEKAKEKAEEDRLRREAQKLADDEKLAAAAAAEQAGDHEEAEEIIKEEVHVAPPVVATTVPKVNGNAMVEVWKWEQVDFSKVPDKYKMLKEPAINAEVRNQKGATSIEGIRVYSVTQRRGVKRS